MSDAQFLQLMAILQSLLTTVVAQNGILDMLTAMTLDTNAELEEQTALLEAANVLLAEIELNTGKKPK